MMRGWCAEHAGGTPYGYIVVKNGTIKHTWFSQSHYWFHKYIYDTVITTHYWQVLDLLYYPIAPPIVATIDNALRHYSGYQAGLLRRRDGVVGGARRANGKSPPHTTIIICLCQKTYYQRISILSSLLSNILVLLIFATNTAKLNNSGPLLDILVSSPVNSIFFRR